MFNQLKRSSGFATPVKVHIGDAVVFEPATVLQAPADRRRSESKLLDKT